MICTKCNKNKPISEFGEKFGKRNKLCKSCLNLSNRQYEARKERRKAALGSNETVIKLNQKYRIRSLNEKEQIIFIGYAVKFYKYFILFKSIAGYYECFSKYNFVEDYLIFKEE